MIWSHAQIFVYSFVAAATEIHRSPLDLKWVVNYPLVKRPLGKTQLGS